MKKLFSKRILLTFLIVFLSLIVLCMALYFIFEPKIDRTLYPREFKEYVEKYAEQ